MMMRSARGELLADRGAATVQGVREGGADMILTWSDTLSIGHGAIDREHKRIIDTVARLFLVVPESNMNEEATQLFGEIIDLLGTHFHNEELVMRVNRYPDTDTHIKLHGEFFSQLTGLLYLLETGSDRVAQGLIQCVHAWAFDHIMIHDRRSARYLEANRL